jgi:hypothetical protein
MQRTGRITFVREFKMSCTKQKLCRLTAVVAVLAAFAIPCAGWAWDGGADAGSDAPGVSATP